MNEHGLTKANLVATLPVALQKDPSAVALAEAMADLLAQRPKEIEQLLIYPAIDRLPESLLDILAYDFKVDWWDANYSLEEKRRVFKDSWYVHKHMGTKAAVVTAISAIFPDTTLQEWWEYGGAPYCFRLNINITDASGDAEKRRQVLSRLNFYKSLRSHVESVRYSMTAPPAHILAGGGVLGSIRQEHLPKVVLAAAPPKGEAYTRSGGALAGIRGRMTARAVLPAVPAPQARGGTRAGGGVFSTHSSASVKLPLPRLPAVCGGGSAGVCAGAAGMHIRIQNRKQEADLWHIGPNAL